MRTRVTVLTLCVCVFVRCLLAPYNGYTMYMVLNTGVGFLLSVQDFQLTDFFTKASFRSYDLSLSFFRHGGHFTEQHRPTSVYYTGNLLAHTHNCAILVHALAPEVGHDAQVVCNYAATCSKECHLRV